MTIVVAFLCALCIAVPAATSPAGGAADTLRHAGGHGATTHAHAPPTPQATVTTSKQAAGRVTFAVGYDSTQHAHLASDAGGNPTAVSSALHLLHSLDAFQNVALMGWGAADPEPSPGQYAWSSLDSRVEVMGATVPATKRMITLCTAPGWMKVGGSSQEWNMNDAVAPSHYTDFADLAAQTALRYDGKHRGANGRLLPKVDDFDVWNSMKGFWDATANSWNVAGYTQMYNDVYAAIKAVRPNARIGGPYAPVGAAKAADVADPSTIQGSYGVVDQRALDVITYWLQHKSGAQFLTVEGGPGVTSESGFASGQYFVAVDRWLRALNPATYPGAPTLPVMWAEFYPGLSSAGPVATGQRAVAIDMSSFIQAGLSGASDLFVWEMEGNAAGAVPSTGEGVWTDTAAAGGGAPTALYRALDALHTSFGPRTSVVEATVAGPVAAIASRTRVLLISQSSSPLTVDVNGSSVQMAPYEVSVVPTGRR